MPSGILRSVCTAVTTINVYSFTQQQSGSLYSEGQQKLHWSSTETFPASYYMP